MKNRMSSNFQERIGVLATAYANNLPEKIDEIEVLWKRLMENWDRQILQDFHRNVHDMAGNGKIFGFPELSETARVLERQLKHLLQQDILTDPIPTQQIDLQLRELKRVFAESAAKVDVNFEKSHFGDSDATASNLIYVVNHDSEIAEELALQIRYYGYEAHIFNRLDHFQTAILQNPDAVVLMEIDFPENEMAGIQAMKAVQQMATSAVRVIFVSANDNIEYRLEAIRAGGIAYFVKPFNPVELIEKLDLFTASQVQDAFRILIVDDNQAVLSYHTALLEQAEMLVKSVLNPMELVAVLKNFNPDLILMDMHMPQCNGLELVKVIRQLDGYDNIPIIYLASEADFISQNGDLDAQGDGFFPKPVIPKQLISAITMRVIRARSFRALMVHDSLTGMLHHTAIKEELMREVVRANRLNTPLSYALVDIDFFNKINDQYGYTAGDRVIKSLSRLLKQRLRGTDVIGRHGGEKFAVIMNDTDAASAANVIDEIRNVFSRVLHVGGDEEFSSSFSCGIADVANFQNVASLTEAAEKALFQAKQRGRNKVVINAVYE